MYNAYVSSSLALLPGPPSHQLRQLSWVTRLLGMQQTTYMYIYTCTLSWSHAVTADKLPSPGMSMIGTYRGIYSIIIIVYMYVHVHVVYAVHVVHVVYMYML